MSRGNGLEIAIVGMACRLPGAGNPEELWRNIRDGVESVTFFSDEELAQAGVAPELLAHPRYVKAHATLAGIELFDASFFGFSPREAETLDPQHRLFLECAWEALEDAGYRPDAAPQPAGVYAGCAMSNYFLANLARSPRWLAGASAFQVSISNDKDHLATRVAYELDLGGPAITVQTACSSSLVAVHLACQGLLSGECEVALAGGASLAVPQRAGYLYEEGGILSADGHCRAFDALAAGCVGGSGVAVVVLKRLASALDAGDAIRAVIRGSAVDNDGSAKVGYTAPGLAGQARVVRRAQIAAEVEPDTISYVEAHGTGTALGDTIEIAALTRAFRAGTARRGFCAIASAKTQIGHLDAAAGVAGLLRCALALAHRRLPPNLHFARPNPRIDFAASPFYVNAQLAEWPAGPAPRRAGVSSFGIGGTNAHVVVEEAPEPEPAGPGRPWQLFVLSARTAPALAAAAANLAEHLGRAPGLDPADAAYTLQVGRKGFAHRRAVVARGIADLAQVLAGAAPRRLLAGAGPVHGEAERPVAFLFPGQGAQHPGMAGELYREEAVFRAEIDRCAELLRAPLGRDIRQLLAPLAGEEEAASRELAETGLTQPVLFAVEYALARLWMDWGVKPRVMLGHSLGEYVAACLAGVFTLEEALTLVAARGRLMQGLERGSMLAVPLPEDEVRALLGADLSLAAVNAPALCLVAGPAGAVEQLAGSLRARGIAGSRLHTSHAFHSALVEPAIEPFRRVLESVTLRPPAIPFLSNLTGGWISDQEAVDPGYWTGHLRHTVRFADGMAELLRQPATVLLEVGPDQALSILARRHPARAAGQLVLPTLARPRHPESDLATLLTAAGRLWLAGVPIEWPRLHRGERRRRVALPTYPFERQRYWVEAEMPAAGAPDSAAEAAAAAAEPETAGGAAGEAAGRRRDPADWFYLRLWRQSPPLALRAAAGRPAAGAADPAAGRSGNAAGGVSLLLLDGCGLGRRLGERLAALGGTVIEVEAGEEFAHPAEHRFRLAAGRREDHARLFGELDRAGLWPRRIVYLWTFSPAIGEDPESRRRCLDASFFALLALAQGLADQVLARRLAGTAGERLTVHVVSSALHRVAGGETVSPERATLLGPCNVLAKEIPGVACQSIDLAAPEEVPPGPEAQAAGEAGPPPAPPWREALAGVLLAEVTRGDDPIVACRGGERWLPVFEQVVLPEADEAVGAAGPAQPPAAECRRLRAGGTYLITGGLGGVGLEIASYLAIALGARLALLGVSPFPPRHEWARLAEDGAGEMGRKIRRLLEAEAAGAQVLVLQADVSDRAQMARAVAEVRGRFGAIHGVIHAAGRAPGGLLLRHTAASAAAVLAPKVAGTRVLEELFTGAGLDFLVLFSSLASWIGEAGRCDYCAASAFLDAFPRRAAAAGAPPTLAISWDGWREVGMGARRLPETEEDRAALAGAMSTAEGIEAFRRALAGGPAQLLVSTRALGARLAESRAPTADDYLARLEAERASRRLHPRPPLEIPYAAPATPAEAALAALWQDLLGIEQVGIDDDFLELGGDSLIGLQLMARAGQAGFSLTIGQIFEHPTVRELAALPSAAAAAGEVGPIAGPVPLAPAQLWFCAQELADPQHWNQAHLFEVPARLSRAALAGGVAALLRRHDALRLRFLRGAAGWRQLDGGEPPWPLCEIDLAALPAARRRPALESAAARLQASLDLERGPLLRVALFPGRGRRAGRLLFIAHHLAVDVPSWRILFDELQTAYLQLERGEPLALPAPTTAFTRWAQGLAALAAGGGLDEELAYWSAAHRARPPAPLPLDFPSGANLAGSAATFTTALDAEASRLLLREVPARGRAQVAELLVAALAGALRRWTGAPSLAIDLEGHGREDLLEGADLSRSVGWFTSLFPLRLELAGAEDARELLRRVQRELRGVPRRGIGFGLLRYLSARPEVTAELGRQPLPAAAFGYLGEVGRTPGVEGPFRLAREWAGPVLGPRGRRSHVLVVTAAAVDGELTLNWNYSSSLHREATVAALARSFAGELRALIAYCASSAELPDPLADFPALDLDREALDELLAGYRADGA
jgi:non-ribosomal peptide synthase protein (TIGR01720 family)